MVFCTAEEYVSPDSKLADCLYQCEKSSRSNHSANKDLKLLFKVWYSCDPKADFKSSQRNFREL